MDGISAQLAEILSFLGCVLSGALKDALDKGCRRALLHNDDMIPVTGSEWDSVWEVR